MNTNLLVTFVLLSIANVIIQTIKSIATIKCGKTVAALVNAIAYGLYTFVLIYTNCELNMWLKAFITAAANFVGVYAVKYFEERAKKEKLWKVEVAIPVEKSDNFYGMIDNLIPHNSWHADEYDIYNCYCYTKAQTALVKKACTELNGKMFVMEQNAVM